MIKNEPKPKKKSNPQITKIRKCLEDKDKRISELERRLNNRIKYWYSAGAVFAVGLVIAVLIYACIYKHEDFLQVMEVIGVICSALGIILLMFILYILIWEMDNEEDKNQ